MLRGPDYAVNLELAELINNKKANTSVLRSPQTDVLHQTMKRADTEIISAHEKRQWRQSRRSMTEIPIRRFLV